MKNAPADESGTPDGALHEVARNKVRRAMEALGRPSAAVAPVDEPDDLVQQGLERLRRHVHSFAAVDHAGQPISEEGLVRLVIGPLAERSRDADTAAALLAATTAADPTQAALPRPAPPTLILDGLLSETGYRYVPAPQATGWPADAPARDSHVIASDTTRPTVD